jgi:hypothetical protein
MRNCGWGLRQPVARARHRGKAGHSSWSFTAPDAGQLGHARDWRAAGRFDREEPETALPSARCSENPPAGLLCRCSEGTRLGVIAGFWLATTRRSLTVSPSTAWTLVEVLSGWSPSAFKGGALRSRSLPSRGLASSSISSPSPRLTRFEIERLAKEFSAHFYLCRTGSGTDAS